MLFLPLSLLAVPVSATAALTPEQSILEVSKKLKPIPDREWIQISGDQSRENYTVTRGDTLFGISKRLFGDGKYWPKIWSINHAKITNPHVIRPGALIAFYPGSGISLPVLDGGMDGDGIAPPPPPELGKSAFTGPRSDEWKKLPPQRWEAGSIKIPVTYDRHGFERTKTTYSYESSGFNLQHASFLEKQPVLAEVTGGKGENSNMILNDVVYLTAKDAGLSVGSVYAITRSPVSLRSSRAGFVAYGYPLLAEVRITSGEGEKYTGVIVRSIDLIRRGDVVIPTLPRIRNVSPVPGPSNLDAHIILERSLSTYATAQHKVVYVDRGSEDGIQPGMVFRSFQRVDPATKRELPATQLVRNADFMVIHTSERASSALVIAGDTVVMEDTPVTLLTDVSELLKVRKVKAITVDRVSAPESNDKKEEVDLDALDDGRDLTEEQKKELKQLENWNDSPTDASQKMETPSAPTPEFEAEPLELQPGEPSPEPWPTDVPEGEGVPFEGAPFEGEPLEEIPFDEAPTDDSSGDFQDFDF